ncbi:MAG: tetratricopeptide repeat protein [Alphaproteobacteria bacterium]|nr:tetratricopeptide repeat protein [Alphaproteobacteria bacterium]
MTTRRFAPLLLLAGLVAFAQPALTAQDDWRLPGLFARLLQPLALPEAQQIESTIWQIWLRSENEDTNILMRAGVNAMNQGNFGAALKYFDQMVKDEPGFAEGWNKRATVHYLMGNFDSSVEDVERTLALEPRHFGALSGLGMINMELGNERAALRAFEAALKVHPHLPGAREQAEQLRKKLLGSPT